jgi:gliding motility-associated-like protein
LNNPVLYIILLFTFFGRTQNLVPNPSFEDIVSCPTIDGQIYLAAPWFQPIFICGWGANTTDCSSSDLFNACHVPNPPNWNMGVPNNELGYMVARTGAGYAGIALWQDYGGRERIEVKLLDSLNKIMNDGITHLTSSSNLQFKFTSDSLLDNQQFGEVYYIPSVSNLEDSIISDTSNWTEISGCYLAAGGEWFLTIGNFYNNANSTVEDPTAAAAYYFIDDVVVELSNGQNCGCNIENPEGHQGVDTPNVFSPNNDGVNDIWQMSSLTDDDYIVILNRWGNEIVRLNKEHPSWDGTILGKNASEGVYYYKAQINGDKQTGFIQLIR